MKKVVVLGAGLIGGVMAKDLSNDCEVTAVDINPEALKKLAQKSKVKTQVANLTDSEVIKHLVKDFDLVVGALPGFMGFNALKTAIQAGKNVADISFFPEDPFELDKLAKKNKVIVIMDCGVAPGMSNMILGYHYKRMKISNFDCIVGGLPLVHTWPYNYKVVFSAIDVIEEYTRPARYVENGVLITRPALSDSEFVEFNQVGTLESFNTDGLRSLLRTIKIPNMKEKTLRFPGHIEYMKVLRETGFFSQEPIEINGTSIKPIDFTAKLLFPLWKLKPKEEEFTVMRINITGKEKGKPITYIYDLYDKYDTVTQMTSMARTTGFTCTAMARLILNKKYKHVGISPPEFVGLDEKCFKSVLSELAKKNIIYKKQRLSP